MSSALEQELLNDFGESDSGGEEYQETDDLAQLAKDFGGVDSSDEEEEEEVVDEEALYAVKQKKKEKKTQDIQGAEELLTQLEPILDEIVQTKNVEALLEGEQIEENPEYRLLTQANEMSTSIDNEIVVVHKHLRDLYSLRFPYLEELIKNPVEYAKTVAILKNEPLDDLKRMDNADNLVRAPLKDVLPGPSLMVVSVEATRATGRLLNDTELEAVLKACSMMLALDEAKNVLTAYVQSRMIVFAPNLTNLVGSLTAAQLVNYSGGLQGLAQKPACNIMPLGSNKASGLGLATNVGVRQQGFLYYSPIIQNIRQDLKKQAMRIVAAKVVLAARVDSVHSSPDGSQGQRLKEDCEKRLDKLTEPPPNRGQRSLPAPDDRPARKRGGRRARKAKEATAMTEIRKAQNRMAFGKEEKEVGYGDSVKGLGMIGASDSGRIRAQQIDGRTRAKLSKKNAGWGGPAGNVTSLGGSEIPQLGGTATTIRNKGIKTGVKDIGGGMNSVAFTPVQGIELIDPRTKEQMSRKRKAAEDRWFNSGTFSQINGATSQINGTAKVDSGGFKIPSLPAKKPKTEQSKGG
ncbi:Nop domain-containing protein [Polyplosphaeria fusca]|uniref:Nop domain-containing protein n=1 Tax=Polyplosphaeria fusca TaxID=682080 RepID=A0A9P4QTR3_9PLEO|nr:Nop domain-containing protein [Polyplosphaeria fusca]